MAEHRIIRCVQNKDAVSLLAELNKAGRSHVKDIPEAATALCLAAETGYHCCARMLLDFDVAAESKDYRGEIPITLSARANNVETVTLLLEKEANIFSRNRKDETALDIACEMGYLDIVSVVLRHLTLVGRPHHVTGLEWQYFCYSALVAACDADKTDVLQELINAEFNLNLAVVEEVGTPLHAAIEAGNVACAEMLINRGADIEALRPCILQTPLAACAENNQVEIAKLLVAAGCEIDRQTHECSNALTVACHYGSEEMAYFLLDTGADPRIVNPWGFTALFMAVDSPRILKRLINENLDVNFLCGERGEAALHLAAVIGDKDVVIQLLEAGSDINLRTSGNENALWLAVWKGHEELTKFLISRNCEMDIPSNSCQVYAWDYLPLEIALGSENFNIARILVTAGCSIRNFVYFPKQSEQTGFLEEIPWLRLRPETLQHLKCNPKEKLWFINQLKSPNSLKHSCRLYIRKLLGDMIEQNVKLLGLPAILKMYVMFSDL